MWTQPQTSSVDGRHLKTSLIDISFGVVCSYPSASNAAGLCGHDGCGWRVRTHGHRCGGHPVTGHQGGSHPQGDGGCQVCIVLYIKDHKNVRGVRIMRRRTWTCQVCIAVLFLCACAYIFTWLDKPKLVGTNGAGTQTEMGGVNVQCCPVLVCFCCSLCRPVWFSTLYKTGAQPWDIWHEYTPVMFAMTFNPGETKKWAFLRPMSVDGMVLLSDQQFLGWPWRWGAQVL